MRVQQTAKLESRLPFPLAVDSKSLSDRFRFATEQLFDFWCFQFWCFQSLMRFLQHFDEVYQIERNRNQLVDRRMAASITIDAEASSKNKKSQQKSEKESYRDTFRVWLPKLCKDSGELLNKKFLLRSSYGVILIRKFQNDSEQLKIPFKSTIPRWKILMTAVIAV